MQNCVVPQLYSVIVSKVSHVSLVTRETLFAAAKSLCVYLAESEQREIFRYSNQQYEFPRCAFRTHQRRRQRYASYVERWRAMHSDPTEVLQRLPWLPHGVFGTAQSSIVYIFLRLHQHHRERWSKWLGWRLLFLYKCYTASERPKSTYGRRTYGCEYTADDSANSTNYEARTCRTDGAGYTTYDAWTVDDARRDDVHTRTVSRTVCGTVCSSADLKPRFVHHVFDMQCSVVTILCVAMYLVEQHYRFYANKETFNASV